MRTKTLIVTAVTAMLALGLTTALNAADWVRDANGHVLIQSKADLETLRDWVAAGENTVGMTFLQTADIDLCDVVWAGIGARDQKDNLNEQGFLANPFRGVYDGHGHTILNVKLKAGDYDGFFNSVDRATIRNLKMSIRENGIDTTTSGSAFVTNHTMAVFVGVAKESTLANLETIRGETVATREFRSRKDASGIVGLMVDGVVEGCTNNLDVTFGTVDNRKGAGIVLLTQSGSDAVKIKSCLNAGRVRCNTCAQAGAGGILGFALQETLIECCENRGSVETVVEQGAHVGTIVGFCDKALRITSKANKAQDSILSAGLPLVGLNFATVENSVASFVADDALTIGSVYRVMTSVLTNAFHFSSSGSIAFDCELNRNFRLDVTAESGLVLSSSEVNGVRTYRAEPTITVGVSNVVTRQRYPWNGLVDIDCEIACSSAQGNVNLWIEAKNKATGQTLPVRHIWLENDVTCTNALAVKAGRHRLVWDAGADAPNVVSSDVTITVRVQVPAGQAGSGSVRGDQATGTPMRLDTRTGVRIVSEDAKETLVYSPRWGGAANCAVTADGVVIKTASSEGEVTWSPTSVGMHTLTFAAGNVAYTVQFRVKGALFPMADGGTGTQESPYLISSVDGLENLRLAVEDGMAGTAHFKLINDLDMSAYGPWPGIGQYDPNDTTGENAFRGVFDGGGHTIRGLYFTRRTYGGLFNQVWGGTVRNLSIEFGGQSGFAFAANDTNVSTNEACGAAAFVGHAAGNACLEGLTSLGRIEGTHNVAGIVIRLGGAEGCTVVRGCTNRAEIVGHYTKASGISVLTIDDGSTVLERCCNEGIVHATAGTTVTGSLIGCDGVSAMLAYCSQPTTIRDCENRGNVFADEPTALVGELVGLSRLEIAGSGNIIVKGKRSLGSSGGFSDLYVGRVVNGNVVCGVPLSNNQSYEVLASFPSNFVYRLENDGDWISFDTTVADFNGQIAKSSPQQIILERRDGSVRLFTVQTLESGDGNVVHAGQLTTNETWTSESVHLVTDEIKVPSGRTLTIEPGAVVKFATGTSLIVNGSCLAHGVVFTHLFDDTVGGDTLKDGDATTPVMGAYTLSGNINEDDATEERYSAPQTLTSSISGTVRLKGHKVYLAKSSVTVNSGATLTFLPGAIVKFASGCSLTVRGTLDALGTRAEPIIFTSINDDSYGGKTEVSTHNPQPGDWSKIGINGGRANFSHAYVLYSSRNSTTGAINMNGGTVVFTDGIISHGKYDAVGVESGRFFMTNSVISDCLLAFRHWARDPIVNCVIYDCGRLTQGGGQTFVNCIFSRISETWEAFGFPQNGTTYRNCCFWNETGSVLTAEGKQDAMTVCGKNGNVWGNPLFLSPDAGDFRIKSGSPCVDAADGTMAPETDTWGQPRKTVLAKEFVTGTPSARGECADIGIYEVIPDDVKGDVDLVPVAISGADAATPGETLLVEWQVANNGEKHMSGSWRDTIMLVSENGQQVVLGDKATTETIRIGEVKTCRATFTVPALAEGLWRLKVNVNSYHDVFEGSLGANNALVGSDPITIAIRATQELASDGVLNAGIPTVVKLTLDAADDKRMIHINLAQGVQVTYGFGFVPSGVKVSGSLVSGQDGVFLQVPDEVEELYIVIESDTSGQYELERTVGETKVFSILPQRININEPGVISIEGQGFSTVTNISLSINGESIKLPWVIDGDSRIKAGYTALQLRAGTGDIRLEGKSGVIEAKAVIRLDSESAQESVQAHLILPPSSRAMRVGVGYVEYANASSSNARAPIFILSGEGKGTVLASSPDGPFVDTIRVVGIGNEYPKGVLKPNETYRVPFYYRVNNDQGARYAVSLSLVDSNSALVRNSAIPKWNDFTLAISGAATRINGTDGEISDYDVIYENAMRLAYDQPAGVVRGTIVFAADGSLVAGEKVVLLDDSLNVCSETISDEKGRFGFFNVETGLVYSVELTTLQGCEDEIVLGSDLCAEALVYAGNYASVTCRVKGPEPSAVYLVDEYDTLTQCVKGEEGFVAAHLEDGVYEVYYQFDGYYAVTNDCTIEISKGLVSERMPDPEVVATGKVRLRFVDQNGLETFANLQGVVRLGATGEAVEFVTDAKGEAELNLPPGESVLESLEGCRFEGDGHFVVESGVTKNIDVRAKRIPFAALPSMGTAPLESCFMLSETNGLPAIASCKWDFNADGVWDAEGFIVTNVFADVGVFDIKAQVAFMDGKTSEYISESAIRVWEKYEYELAEDAIELNAESGFDVVERNDESLVLRINDKRLVPKFFNEGDKLVLPDELDSPRKVVSIEAVDESTIRVVTERVPMVAAFKTARLKLADLTDPDETEPSFGGTIEAGLASISIGTEDFNVSGSFGVKGQLYVNIEDSKLQAVDFSATGGGLLHVTGRMRSKNKDTLLAKKDGKLDLRSDELKPKKSTNKAKKRKNANKRQKQLKKDKKSHPLFWKVIPLGYVPLDLKVNYVHYFEFEGELTVTPSLTLGFSYRDGKWIKSRTADCGLNECELESAVKFRGGIEVEAGAGLTRDSKTQSYGVHLADINLEFGAEFSAGITKSWVETEPDSFGAYANGYLDAELNVLKVAIGKYFSGSLFKVSAETTVNVLKCEWQTPMPGISFGTACYVDDGVSYNLTSTTDTKMDLDFREWLVGNSNIGASDSVAHTFIVKPGDSVAYDVILRERYVPRSENWIVNTLSRTFGVKRASRRISLYRKEEDEPPEIEIENKDGEIPQSSDPNEMVGPLGKGDPETERFVKSGEWMTYTIYFENKADATAAAQEVTVTNPLSDYLDWSTFEMGEVAFNNQIDLGLVGAQRGTSEATMTGTNFVVRTELSLDEQSGVAKWYLRIVDPTTATGWPEDILAGFLPPNDETFRGEGHITYRVKVREDAPKGARIDNSATIVFDYNDPIETDPAWWNTVSMTTEETTGQCVNLDLVEDLGVEIPEDVDYAAGDKVTVKVEGLAKGLKVVATPVYEDPNAKKKVIVGYKYTIEGVPTETVDFDTQTMYARVSVTYKDKTKTADKTGKAESLQPVPLSIEPAEVRTLEAGVLNEVYEPVDIASLWPEVADAKTNPKEWSFKGWPAGLKYNATAKDASWSYKDDKATVKATAEPYTVYGQPTKAGEYPITATWKHKLADGKTTVSETFSAVLTVWGDDGASDFRAVSQAYVALTKNFGTGVTAMSGLPTGLKFTAKAVAATAKAPAQEAGDVYGTPTKPGVFAVTATLADKTKETFLWKVTEGENPGLDAAAIGWADAKVKFDGETKKATILQGLEADFAVEASALAAGAKVTVSGLPSGLKYDAKTGRITGVATKQESKVVTVKVVQNGVTEVRTFAIVVDANLFAGAYHGAFSKHVATAVITPAAGGTAKLVLDEYVPSKNKVVKYTATAKGFSMAKEYDAENPLQARIVYEFALKADAKGNPDFAAAERVLEVTLVGGALGQGGLLFGYGSVSLRAKDDPSSESGFSGQVYKALTPADYATFVETVGLKPPPVMAGVARDNAGRHLFAGSAVLDEKKLRYQVTGKLRDGTAVKVLQPLCWFEYYLGAPSLFSEKGCDRRTNVAMFAGSGKLNADIGIYEYESFVRFLSTEGVSQGEFDPFDPEGIPATAAEQLGGESELVLDAAELAASGFEGEAPAFRFVVNGTSWAKAKLDIYAPGVEEGAKPLASLVSAKLQASAGYVFKGSFKWEAKVGGDGNTYSFELVPSTTDGKTFVGRCEVKPAKGAAIVVTARLKPEIE